MYVVPVNPDGKDNRDAGKAFRITEMSAYDAEVWAQRALLAMAQSGVPIDEEVIRAGLGAVTAVGLRALLTMGFDDARPLLDEMMTCVEFVPDRSKADISRRPDADDIEELSTLLALRAEVVELHTGFSIPVFLSNLGKAGLKTTEPMPITPTSPASSEA
jgi:hypothetical protein